MHEDQVRQRLEAERAEVLSLLEETESASRRDMVVDSPGDQVDAAQVLTAEGGDEAVTGTLRDRLGAIDRALRRLDEGTYGRSVISGAPIPPERLEADPTAEVTVEEAAARLPGDHR